MIYVVALAVALIPLECFRTLRKKRREKFSNINQFFRISNEAPNPNGLGAVCNLHVCVMTSFVRSGVICASEVDLQKS